MSPAELDSALAEIFEVLRVLKMEQAAGLITCDADFEAARTRRQMVFKVRKRFHEVTKRALDDIDRRRTKNWLVKKPRVPLKRSTPKLLPQLRKGSGRFTPRQLFERAD